MHPHRYSWRTAAFAALTLAFIAGCSASGVEPVDNDGGVGGGSTTSTGPSMGGAGGAGGGGGNTGPCATDCSAIDTPMCLKSVCNEGEYPGTVGECVIVNDDDGTACDDNLFCTTNDTCQAGVCVGGPQNTCGMEATQCEAVTCDETAKACTTEAANQGMGCTPDDLCEVGGTCTNGLCVGQPKDCFFAPITDCEVAICNPANGICEGHPDATKDGQVCVLGGDLCMVDKTCNNGQCLGGNPKDCSNLDVGCYNGECNQTTGQCEPMQVPAGNQCNTATDQCNIGICDAMQNCIANPVANGTVCDDYNICTTGDLCTAGVCGGVADPNCTTYFEGNFEAGCPPGGWVLGGEWQCGAPSGVGPAAAFEGVNLIGTILNGNYSNNLTYAANYAETPPIGLGGAIQPVLSYYDYVDTEGSSFDGYNVKISTDGGNTFTLLTNLTPAYNLSSVGGEPAFGGHLNAWRQVTADLSAYIGQQVILQFAMRTDGSVVYPGVYIDAISVSEADAIPILITTPSLPDALESVPYSFFVQKAGGSSNAVWSITGGTNIAWLSIDPNTGELFGTPAPADVGAASVTVHVEEPTNPNNFDDVTFNFAVQQTVWAETFEGACPNAWTLTGDWQCGVPTSGPGSAFAGTQGLATQLAGTYNNNQAWGSTHASSPTISLVGTTAPLLRFWVWYHIESCCDGFNVKVSTDGINYAIAPNVTPAYNGTADTETCWLGNASALGWQQHAVDLSAYAGQTINLRFDFRSDSSVVNPGVYIDDVTISD